MGAAVRECKKTLDFNDGKRSGPCPYAGFVNPERARQTQYCDLCKRHRDQERLDENRTLYRTKYDPDAAAHRREHWAETHGGQTWAQYIAERRSLQPERTRESNRRAAARYRASKKGAKAQQANRHVTCLLQSPLLPIL